MDEQRDPRDRLPPEIYDFAIRAGSDAGRSVASISLRQTGRMRHGEGRLDVRALGMIPLVRSVGSPALTPRRTYEVSRGLPWAPDAILLKLNCDGGFTVGAGRAK